MTDKPRLAANGTRHARLGGHPIVEDSPRVKEAAKRLLAKDRAKVIRGLIEDKLTPEFVEECVKLVLAGNHPSSAAKALGVVPNTFKGWMQAGEELYMTCQNMNEDQLVAHLSSSMDPEGRRLELYRRVSQAEGEWEVTTVSEMQTHFADGRTWTGYMTHLERRDPSKWGRRFVEPEEKDTMEKAVRAVLVDQARRRLRA